MIKHIVFKIAKRHDEQFVEDLRFFHLELITITRLDELFEDKLHFALRKVMYTHIPNISFLSVKKTIYILHK